MTEQKTCLWYFWSQANTQFAYYFVELPPGNGVLTLKKEPVFEKYRTLASLTFFSAACGLTISRPFTNVNMKLFPTGKSCAHSSKVYRNTWSGVKATDDAVPATWRLTVVAPPYACWRCRFRCSALEIRTFVFSSIVGPLIRPGPPLPIIPRV